MTHFAALAVLNVDDALPDAWVDEVKLAHDYLIFNGADLASAGTINITNEFHRITGTTTITTISDALGAQKGQQVWLQFASAIQIGTSGNITTNNGGNSYYAAGDIGVFIYDGTTKWVEVGSSDPIDLNQVANQSMAGNLVSPGFITQNAAGNSCYRNYLLSSDTQPALDLRGNSFFLGLGGSTAVDTSMSRSAAGAWKIGNVIRMTRLSATYSASITIDCTTGGWVTIGVTNATAFTINAPTNPPGAGETQELTIEVLNSSGGAMGVITWNAVFRPLSAGQPVNWTNPANGLRRAAHFRWSGNAWVNVGTTAVDYA